MSERDSRPQANQPSQAAKAETLAERVLARLHAVTDKMADMGEAALNQLLGVGKAAAKAALPPALATPKPTMIAPATQQPAPASPKPLLGPAFQGPDPNKPPQVPILTPRAKDATSGAGWTSTPRQKSESPEWMKTLTQSLAATLKTLAPEQKVVASPAGEKCDTEAPQASAANGARVALRDIAEGAKQAVAGFTTFANGARTALPGIGEGVKQAVAGFATFAKEATNAAGLLVGLQSVTKPLREMLGELRGNLSAVSGKLAEYAGTIARAMGAPQAASAAKTAAGWVGGKLKGAAQWAGSTAIGKAAANVASHAKRVGGAGLARVGRAAAGIARSAGGVGKAGLAFGKLAGSAVMGAGKTMGGVGKAAKGVANFGISAVSGVMDAFKSLTSQIMGFVEAFNPAIIEVFNASLRDLSAVIGMALEPIMQVATAAIKDLSATLMPLMRDLRPIIAQVSASFADIGKVMINQFAITIKAIMPIVQMMADGFAAITPLIQTVGAMFSGLVQATSFAVKSVASWLGMDVSSWMGGLRTAMEELARYTLMAAAGFMKLINTGLGDSFIKGVKDAMGLDNLRPRKKDAPPAMGMGPIRGKGGVEKIDATGTAAMKNSSFANFADFGKQVALAATMAGGTTDAPKSSEEWLQKISDSLDGIGKLTSGDMWETLKEKITEAVKAALGGATHSINEGGKRGMDSVMGLATGDVGLMVKGLLGGGA